MKVNGRRLVAVSAAVAVSGALLSGCAPGTLAGQARNAHSPKPGPLSDELAQTLSFQYISDSGVDETINQILMIKNVARDSLAPVLSFKALDKNDHVLPHVKVSTVFGSDRGDLVAPYGSSSDILRFSGPGEHDVADVRVTVRSTTKARFPAGPHDVTTQALDSHGREIERFERFSAVRLTNEDDIPVFVRVAYILWDQPPKGVTQQAVEVTPVGDLTIVPAHSTAVVKVSGRAAAAVARNSYGPAVSIKAYNSQ
ncbi:hypothetical protein ACFVHS_22440 [Streptomyces sp. NPDC057746]|uniref:hypothetical protein n=1 Tax=Streptomyces sp. NPDC057746 TaxID=3346237 RepID=UPI0036A2CB13